MVYELRRVETPEDWAAMHRIRRETLFAPERHPGVVYDEAHPDDAAANHVKLLLMLDGQPIGTARLDLKGEMAAVRIVAIVAERRRQGHGSVMEDALAQHAYKLGITRLMLNSAPDAVGFYEKRGWQRESWDPEELQGMRSDCVQMVKYL